VPEKIENIYIRSQYVQQVFVHGESLKSCIIAIVVPDVDVIKCWAVENGIPGTLSVLCVNPEVKKLILDDMLAWGKEAGLKSFEQVYYRSLFSFSIFFFFYSKNSDVQIPFDLICILGYKYKALSQIDVNVLHLTKNKFKNCYSEKYYFKYYFKNNIYFYNNFNILF